MLVFYWFLRRASTYGALSMQWHFFFLGAAFLLLEAQIISKMALLFGTTWVVNSIVISFLLLLIVLSNMVVGKWPISSPSERACHTWYLRFSRDCICDSDSTILLCVSAPEGWRGDIGPLSSGILRRNRVHTQFCGGQI